MIQHRTFEEDRTIGLVLAPKTAHNQDLNVQMPLEDPLVELHQNLEFVDIDPQLQ